MAFEAESENGSFWDFMHTPSTSIEVREIGKEAISNQASF
jgi:hypothetical protein